MELKHASHAAAGLSRQRFNRTFMELKQYYAGNNASYLTALIGPLWN